MIDKEQTMLQWDMYRGLIANGDTSSLPRDWFETILEEIESLRQQLSGALAAISGIVTFQQGDDGLWAHFDLGDGSYKYTINLDANAMSSKLADAYRKKFSEPTQPKACGAWAGDGYCVLPAGHNLGRLDIPQNHKSKRMKKVVSECWRNPCDGDLTWCEAGEKPRSDWQRFPAGDIEGEVEDGM